MSEGANWNVTIGKESGAHGAAGWTRGTTNFGRRIKKNREKKYGNIMNAKHPVNNH